MILDGLRTHDDPGLERRLLGASNAIDWPLYPRGPMSRLYVGEAAVVALISLVVYLLLVALP
jgi:hypothetical protein